MKPESLSLLRQYIRAIEDFLREFDYSTNAEIAIECGRRLDTALREEEQSYLLAWAREYFPKGARVRVCEAPRCEHSALAEGTIDMIGFFDDDSEIGISIIRDGGGACGPFRVSELTKL